MNEFQYIIILHYKSSFQTEFVPLHQVSFRDCFIKTSLFHWPLDGL